MAVPGSDNPSAGSTEAVVKLPSYLIEVFEALKLTSWRLSVLLIFKSVSYWEKSSACDYWHVCIVERAYLTIEATKWPMMQYWYSTEEICV